MMNKLFDKSAKLRNLRESVVGVDRIKDDPFESDRVELEQYECMLRVLKLTVTKYARCLGEMNNIHDEMTSELKKFYQLNENATQRRQIDLVDTATKSIGEFYDNGTGTVEKVGQLLDALLAMHVGLGTRLRDRDRAHAMKSHYDIKVGLLKQKSEGAKTDRNEKKQKEAMEEYDKSEQIVIKECRDALNTKFKDTDQVVGMYLKYLVEYYGGIGDSFKSIRHLPADMMTTVTNATRAFADPEEDMPVPLKPSAPPKEEILVKPVAPKEEIKLPIAPKIQAKSSELTDHEKEHNDLRAALGLRVKGAPAKKAEESEDNDSDLSTPPRR